MMHFDFHFARQQIAIALWEMRNESESDVSGFAIRRSEVDSQPGDRAQPFGFFDLCP
jgi:hypothetical protein